MIVSYHDFQLNNEPFIDGANLYSVENSKLIKEFGKDYFTAQPHDIRNVVSGKTDLSKLRSDDVIVSNAGPYAFAYHYLREKKGLKFRIVRDVQTSFWQGYFLQEKLCSPLIRENDIVLFLSEFQRQLFLRLFPKSLNEENTFVCAPFMHFFPKKLPTWENDYDGLTLGWVGRVTHEKGFHVALDAFIKIKNQLENVRMIVAGGRVQPKSEKYIFNMLKKNKISSDAFVHLNNRNFIPHSLIWEIYKKFDIFLFPSVSSNESLGRVIVEACYCKLPVIAAYHAAAPEILDKRNLLPVTYKEDLLQIAAITSVGHVEPDDIIKKVLDYKKLSKGDISFYKDHDIKYANILLGKQKKEKPIILDERIKQFIAGVRLYQDNPTISSQKSFDMLRDFIVKENYATLMMWHFYTSAYMGFNPYILFFSNKGRTLMEKLRLRFQTLIMKAKNPIKRPFKMYSYLKNKSLAKKLGY